MRRNEPTTDCVLRTDQLKVEDLKRQLERIRGEVLATTNDTKLANDIQGRLASAKQSLSEEMQRLHKSCHQLVWLNPLLRYDKFEARPAGVRAMLPHVDRFLPVHNLKSLVALAHALSENAPRHVPEKRAWK